MPITSDQIAQMNSQYMMAGMGRMQHASMIGSSMPLADSIVGGGLNRFAAVGSPLAMAGLGVMGLDPISLGLRAGMGAYGGGAGFMGAGMAGLGAAGLAGAGIMGAGYVGNQVFTGAQQQQQFNSMMNSTYRFANNYGGTGFSRGGLGDIGTMLRQMTTEQGPSGQMVGFEELGRLASNMGRMGMSQGVRDAKDFSDKFREMIKTVKEIAQSMGTSLEEAQRMMGEMRGAGVFGNRNAAAFASRVRSGAFAGGMATSELTGMMSIGSQISRAVGGRGRAGAAGGIETLTNIGVAQQLGVMSEEDIYNVTGMTGAEGRRAMATRQMEMSAQFLRGGLGRRFLASVAGKGGRLDESSIEEYLSGGVGTDRTMEMANRNLGRIGRADFIRNEGRLRGSALERLGGLSPMIAMKGWLDQRGINVNEDSDRAMIFMQRQLGMGNDEAEMMLRQVRELPNILRQRQVSAQDDSFMRRMEEKKSQVGLEGIKRKFESARAEVQAVLQGVGASFYESMSETVEGFVNRLTGTYVKETRRDVAGAFRSALGGGAMGAEAASMTFGIGTGSLARGSGVSSSFLGAGPSDLSTFQDADAARFSKAGFGFGGGDLTSHLNTVSQVSNAFRGGDVGLAGREGVQSLGKAGADAVRRAFMNRTISGKGMDRLASFGAYLKSQSGAGNLGIDELAQRYASAGAIEKAQIMASFTGEGGAGVSGEAAMFSDPGLRGIYGSTGFATVGEGEEAVGRAFMGESGASGQMSALTLAGSPFASLGGTSVGRSGGLSKEVGRFLSSDAGRDSIARMLSGSKKTREDALIRLSDEMKSLQDKESLTSDERGRLQGMRGIMFAQKLSEMRVNGASKEEIDAEAGRLAKEFGLSPDQVRSQSNTVLALANRAEEQARAQAGERAGEEARSNIAAMQRGGIVTGNGDQMQINAVALDKAMGGKSSESSRAFLAAMLGKQKAFAQMGPGKSPQEIERLFNQGLSAANNMNELMSNMSVSEQRQLANALRDVEGAEDVRGELGRAANLGSQIEAGRKRGKFGGLGAAANNLGVSIGNDEISSLMKSGGIRSVAAAFADRMGDGLSKNKAFMEQLEGALGTVQTGSVGKGAQAIQGMMGHEVVQEARKKSLEKAQSEDPNQNLKLLGENSTKMAKFLETSVTLLTGINTKMEKNAEDWNPFS